VFAGHADLAFTATATYYSGGGVVLKAPVVRALPS
jgi:hypothetical protein